jgi:N-acetyl sugar amidotransferase
MLNLIQNDKRYNKTTGLSFLLKIPMVYSNQCTNCVLDGTVEDISFNENGICNYCEEYVEKQGKHLVNGNGLNALISRVKKARGEYNCIVGISGGLDSSYLLHFVKESGLNPLAVHCDSGWNSETASENIHIMTKQLDVDLYTFVINWEEFKELQKAYLRAGVIDLEFPTDHVYVAALFSVAKKYNIKTIFTGNNLWSEGVMPNCWIHNKGDTLNMLDIYRRNSGGRRLDSIPVITILRKFYYYNICRIKNVFLLNYTNYNRDIASEILKSKYDWRDHPTKHGETIFTRFYHRYILPKRFNIDIRKAHLSSLICCGQISREAALEKLKEDVYPTELMNTDKKYVLKKFNLSESEFERMMGMKRINHNNYKSEQSLKRLYNRLRNLPFGLNSILNISNHC